ATRRRRRSPAAPARPTPTSASAAPRGSRRTRQRAVEAVERGVQLPARRAPRHEASEAGAPAQAVDGRELHAGCAARLLLDRDLGGDLGEYALERRLLDLLPPRQPPRPLGGRPREVGSNRPAPRRPHDLRPGCRRRLLDALDTRPPARQLGGV